MLKSKMDEEAAGFWEAHNFRDHHRETRKTVIAFVKRPKGAITLRLDPDDFKSVEKIAERKGLDSTSLLRMWIREHLTEETKHIT